MDTATQEFAPVSKIDEGSLAPEFWQNITCVGEVPVDDYFGNKKYFHNEKDIELSYFVKTLCLLIWNSELRSPTWSVIKKLPVHMPRGSGHG